MKKLVKYALPLLMLGAVACKNSGDPTNPIEPAPQWKAAAHLMDAAPHWVVSPSEGLPSSMTITATTPNAMTSCLDTVAAITCFEDKVLGVTGYAGNDIFSLYVHGPNDSLGYYQSFRLCYYCAQEHQCYVSWIDGDLLFENDRIMGTHSEPYEFTWVPCGNHTMVAKVNVWFLSDEWQEGDELALFVGEECRQTTEEINMERDVQKAELFLPYDINEGTAVCKHYHKSSGKITTASCTLNFLSTTNITL